MDPPDLQAQAPLQEPVVWLVFFSWHTKSESRQELTMSASVLVSFNAILVNPFILGLEGSLSDNTITSGEGTRFSLFSSLQIKSKKQRMG